MTSRDEFLYQWLCSPNFFDDLELVYSIHMPSKSDFNCYLEPCFHEMLPNTQKYKKTFESNYKMIEEIYETVQSYLSHLTDTLMDERPRYEN